MEQHGVHSFIKKVLGDTRLTPQHVSLCLSLLHTYIESKMQNPFYSSRAKLMQSSKIKAQATYHKCLSELIKWNYVTYVPSYNPFTGSEIRLNID